MDATQHTTLSGALVRWGKDIWAWSDHTPAPQVKDITPSWHYNFRCSAGCVEVPVKLAEKESELAWVRTGGYPRGVSGDHIGERVINPSGRITRRSESGKVIPEVYMVPLSEWDDWDAKTCIGAKWEKSDEPEILAKAKSLGWVSAR